MHRAKLYSTVYTNLIITKPSIFFPSVYSSARFSTRKVFKINTSWEKKTKQKTAFGWFGFFADYLGQGDDAWQWGHSSMFELRNT